MGDPQKTANPTLMHILTELVSAMSSLNMPDPRHATPDDVEHAYEHLEAAAEMLTMKVQHGD